MRIVREVRSVTQSNNYYEVQTNACAIRIYFVTDSIIRIRVGFAGDFAEESYSLVTTAWEDRLDEVLGDERKRIDVAASRLDDNNDYATINGNILKVIIRKNPAAIEVYDKTDTLLHRDIPELAYRCDSNDRRYHTSEIVEGDCFYGFGEKTGRLNKLHQFMTMSPNDTMGYDPINADSLYKHIPFYIKANKKTGKACGYFYHNMNECTFDMGRSHSNYWPHHSTYEVDHGDIDLFFIAGPSVKDVVRDYTYLTGRSAMLPKYALGYLGSSMYYSELDKDCDKAIEGFIDTAIDEDIPIDGFQLSSGYTTQKTDEGDKRCVFTWNSDRFPNPTDFFKAMDDKGIVVSPNVKPGSLLVHPNIDKFTSKDMLVKASDDNESLYAVGALKSYFAVGDIESHYAVGALKSYFAVGEWWGGKGVFADFTNPKCREEWKKLLKDNVLSKGTTSVWNDNCEYDSIVDKDAKVDYDGKGATIGETRVVMANIMCKITDEAIRENNPNIRPFIVCRAGHSGIQRYAQSWAGDNRTSWDTLKYNQATVLGMSMSGVSNYGADIGGFYGEVPSPELFVRWVQAGIFMPRFSIHSVNIDNTVTEPWMYLEYTHFIRDAIKFRYRLFPYMYSLMMRSHSSGDMIMTPLMAAFPSDDSCYDIDDIYLLGDSLLVANVLDKGTDMRKVYLPKGSNYYGFSYENDRVSLDKFEGGATAEIPVDLESIPLFVVSGAIIPIAKNQMMNLSKDDVNSLRIICVADKSSAFDYYEDDGITLDYKKGIYRRTHIDMKVGDATIISFSYEGEYKSTIEDIELAVTSDNNCPHTVVVDGRESEHYLRQKDYEQAEEGWYYDIESHTTLIRHPYIPSNYTVAINYSAMDMLGM